MGSLLEALGSVTGGLTLDDALSAQSSQFGQITAAVSQLVDHPPGDVTAYFTHLQELSLPALQFGSEFGDTLAVITSVIGGNAQVNPVTQAMQALQANASSGLTSNIAPLLEAIHHLQTLLNSDWSAGLVDTRIAPPPPAPPAPPGQPPALPQAPQTPVVISTTQVTQAKALVDALPASMNVKDLLKWLHALVGTSRPDYFYFRAIPLVDDLRDPLDSLVRWDQQDGAALAAEFNASLQQIAALVSAHSNGSLALPFTVAAQAAITALPTVTLQTHGSALATALQSLPAAVSAGNTGAISSALQAAQTAMAGLDTATAAMTAHEATFAALENQLAGLADTLEIRIARLLVLLTPRATWADLAAHIGGDELSLTGDNALAPLTELTDRLTSLLDNALGAIDISEIMEPVVAVIDDISAGVEQLEQALVQLNSNIHAGFDEARNALDGLGLESLGQQAEAAMDNAITTVQTTLGQGLQPALNTLQQAMTGINDTLGGFDPEQMAQPVRDVINGIRDTFASPAVADALAQLKNLKTLAKSLEGLSFTPVADEVIKSIDAIKSALASIDQANLSAPMPDLIAEAMSVLPASVKPVTDPLISQLGELIEQGPVPLLAELRDLPKPVFEEIRKLEPGALLGEKLGSPFTALREKLADFQPSQWLDAADAELEKLRDRLRESASPKGALQPLSAVFDAFVAQLEQCRPGDIFGPLATQISDMLDSLQGVLPEPDFIPELQALLARINSLVDMLEQAAAVARHFADKIALLTDPAAQLDQWLDEIFAKLDDPDAFSASLSALQTAVSDTQADALRMAWQQQRQPLADLLAQANARALHTRIVTARNAINAAAIQALPASQAKTDLLAFMEAFNPGAPAFSRGFRQLTRLQDALAVADSALDAVFATWDQRYGKADGILHAIAQPDTTLDDIRQWIREAIDRQLGKPVADFLAQLKIIGQTLSTFCDGLDNISEALQTQLASITAAPQKLLDLHTRLEVLLSRISQLDLHALQQDIDNLHAGLIGQARALDPRQLEQALEEKFSTLLGNLSLDALITPQLRNDINTSWQQLLKVVDTLDPQLLVVEPMQALWEQDVLPLLDAFDISDSVDTLIAVLQPLDEKLATEMNRVDSAYQAMLAAAPGDGGGNAASAGVSL